ncbi:MAG: signal peptidase I [Lentisphaeria bacterium]|nr:signal peptidase I [Lentisphaeria bacterium]
MSGFIKNFFFPKLNKYFFIRLSVTVVILTVLFSFVLMPAFINGRSMEPSYSAVGFNFCTKLKYKFNPIQVGDVVVIRYVDKKFFLKRVVALENDVVEFRNGVLFVNGVYRYEPYIKNNQCDWNLPPRLVQKNHVYVVGDNRTMPMNQHQFGQVAVSRVVGGVLW